MSYAYNCCRNLRRVSSGSELSGSMDTPDEMGREFLGLTDFV